DRYKAKVAEYHDLSRQARDNTLKFGIGLVLVPIPKADIPTLSITPGSGDAARYYIAVTWISVSGQEGAPSDMTAISTMCGSTVAVQAMNPAAEAAGFNVYIGTTADTLALQTPTPIPVGQTFTLTGPRVPGRMPGNGQPPDTYVVGGPTLRRG